MRPRIAPKPIATSHSKVVYKDYETEKAEVEANKAFACHLAWESKKRWSRPPHITLIDTRHLLA